MKVEYVYDFNMSEQPIGQTKQHNAKANDERDDSAEQSKSHASSVVSIQCAQSHMRDDISLNNDEDPRAGSTLSTRSQL